ncbi:MAG TPA: hypothetical protein VFY76_13390 [Nocardioides sp.]|nr:hypothetical protein [Nocardioides sp.]
MGARTRKARGLALGVVCVVVAMHPAAAHADIGVVDDPVGDSAQVDISRVRVVHENAVKVTVRSTVPLAVAQVYSFWIDTGAGSRPTYRVSFRANSGFDDSLGVVRTFGQRPSRRVRCPGMRARADIFEDAPVSLRVPRRCLDDPRRVRVAVRFEDETTGAVDWAPARRSFTDWVQR